ncbi:SRPBCC domain-containing protein [Lacibacter sp. MH-610]|uniref:SRPBCC family protein n=1 Tax=Lacibacter sp. MH-610 TaxID=3020883 RepID=UPI003892A711
MGAIKWNEFTVRMDVNAPFDKLYAAWATRAGIESWFLRMSEYASAEGVIRAGDEPVQIGDTYKWLWYGWPDETVEHGTILDCNGADYFKFSFGKAGICTVRIYKAQGETIVELQQEQIPENEEGKYMWHVGCKTGWTYYLTNLKSVYQHGIDLRNKKEGIGKLLNL